MTHIQNTLSLAYGNVPYIKCLLVTNLLIVTYLELIRTAWRFRECYQIWLFIKLIHVFCTWCIHIVQKWCLLYVIVQYFTGTTVMMTLWDYTEMFRLFILLLQTRHEHHREGEQTKFQICTFQHEEIMSGQFVLVIK